MVIIIDAYNRIKLTTEYAAPMKRVTDKKEKLGYRWDEYRWFTKLSYCLEYLARKRITEGQKSMELAKYISTYTNTLKEFKDAIPS